MDLAEFHQRVDEFKVLLEIHVKVDPFERWTSLLRGLGARYPLRFYIDEESAVLPEDASEVFAIWERATPKLTIDAEGVDVRCYFFDKTDVDMNISAEDISDEGRLASLCRFLEFLRDVLGSTVRLTLESGWTEADQVRFSVVVVPAEGGAAYMVGRPS